MRIALTADPEIAVPPILYGGIERVIDMLARGLSARGHEVTLFARAGSTCPVETCVWPGADSGAWLDTARNAAFLARHVRARRFDMVHSFSRLAYLAPVLGARVPKLMTYQRAISPRTTGRAQRLARGTLEFSAISRKMMEPVAHIGRWHMAPNGAPLSAYAFRPDCAPDAPLAFLGRVEEIKGPHVAIEVARRAGRRLVIAGNVPDEHRAWFQAHVAPAIDGEAVRYVGPVDDRAKNELLGAAAALLMPISWEEPFGIVMAEAMACGAPVVGFRRGAVPEVVAHGVTGFVVDTLDEMAAAVARLPEIDRAACRARVESLYSDDAVAERYLEIYRDMIARMRRER